ncbi:MAG: protein kinase [Polyangiales bacterium]
MSPPDIIATMPPPHDPIVGQTIGGRWRVLSRLGSGGMSSVYLARHALIDRLSAIKILHPELARESDHRERFLREARAVNRINHPSIVEISDYGEADVELTLGHPTKVMFLVMEYIPGETLHEVLLRGPMRAVALAPLAAQVTAALARAHQSGVIHRDIKPENILVVRRADGPELAKLTDFGVARMSAPTGSTPLADQVFGTPGYIAPEYLLGETEIDGRADLYSLGVVIYEAMCGHLPFAGSNATDLMVRPILDAPTPLEPRLAAPSIADRALAALAMRCLSMRPDERPRDAFAVLAELEAILKQPAISGESAARAVVAATMPAPFPSSKSVAAALAPIAPLPAMSLTHLEEGRPPKLGDVPIDRLEGVWRTYLDALERRMNALGARIAVDSPLSAALHRRELLLPELGRGAEAVLDAQRAIDAVHARARAGRETFGRAIDVLARDLSVAHAHAQTLKDRRTTLHLKRRHAADASAADALLWEEAAVDDDLRSARGVADDLGAQVGALQDELHRRETELEANLGQARVVLEGELAVVSTLQRELEALVDTIVRALDVASLT